MQVFKEMISSNPAQKELQSAFQRFEEASTRLEAKYAELLTETESLRRQLQEKDLEVKRAERLALLGETAAGIAHEIRNPLGSMKLFLSLLRRETADSSSSTALVDQMERSLTALDHVVANILHFAREQQLEFIPLNIHTVIEDQLHFFEASQAFRGSFNVQLRAQPILCANEHALRQVFFNLILNAMQATKNQGVVTIETEDYALGGVMIRVRDNGPGVPAELGERVFSPFVTTKNEGTGLGLAIAHKVIDQHQGSITVTNCGGAEFTIILPRRHSSAG